MCVQVSRQAATLHRPDQLICGGGLRASTKVENLRATLHGLAQLAAVHQRISTLQASLRMHAHNEHYFSANDDSHSLLDSQFKG